MKFTSELVLPLTFPTPSGTHDGKGHPPDTRSLMELSCSNAHVTSLISWGFSEKHAEAPSRGAVMGCDDGSLYIFHPSASASRSDDRRSSPLLDTSLQEGSSRPTGPLIKHRYSHSASRSGSPSSLAQSPSPFHVTSRSRVVSGISKEQAEAPRNYVDFEDETEKLKDMLKGKSPRHKTIADALLPSFEKGLVIDKSPSLSRSSSPALLSTGSGPKRKDEAKSLLSAMNSPIMSPRSPSTPSSPSLPEYFLEGADMEFLTLYCHILPHYSGPWKGVSDIRLLGHAGILVALQGIGVISAFKLKDGTCVARAQIEQPNLSRPAGAESGDQSHDVWIWQYLRVFDNGESTMLLLSAALDETIPSASLDTQNENDQEKARLALFEFFLGDEHGLFESRLEKVGEWYSNGSASHVGLHNISNNNCTFLHVDPEGHFVTQPLQFSPIVPFRLQDPHMRDSNTINRLPLPNPFKALQSRSSEHVPLEANDKQHGRVQLGDPSDIGELLARGPVLGLRTQTMEGQLWGIAWSDLELTAFQYHDRNIQVLFVLPIAGIRDVNWIDDDSFGVTFVDRAESFKIMTVNADNDEVDDSVIHGQPSSASFHMYPQPLSTVELGQYDVLHFASASEVLSTGIDKAGRRRVKSSTPSEALPESKSISRTLWKASHEKKPGVSQKVSLTSILPLEVELIILGFSDGRLCRSSLSEMSDASLFQVSGNVSEPPLDGAIIGLHVVENARTKQLHIVGGADDGTIAIWSLDHLKLCARWTIFTTPLANVVQLHDQKVGPLRGCALCVSQDGTIAVIVIDGFHFLHLIPGSPAPLQKLCLGSDNLLLIYSDRRARLWDVQTKEFWRSMNLNKANELLSQGGWTEISLEDRETSPNKVLTPAEGMSHAFDAASTIFLDVEHFIGDAVISVKSTGTSSEDRKTVHATLEALRSIASLLLTPGLNGEIDCICRERLGIPLAAVSVGSSSCGSSSLVGHENTRDQWCLSPEISASRALSIVATLRALAITEDPSDDSNTVVAFYAASLSQVIGPPFQPPSLVSLARQWFKSSNELRQAARILFDAGVTRLSDEETVVFAERWQHHLPCLQPDADKQSMFAALALFLCGYIAAEKYSLLSASALTDIAKSITMYLHDEQSLYRVLAIDLCSRGFQIWQHYVDAMEILRALFTLATNSRKDAISPQNAGPQARLAVLQIASSNTPLFMTTLALDILNPRGVEHRKSVMQLVAFLIRKRPLVIYPNLPRLMEAVVKSLDPNSTANRDAVLDAATEILGHVVKTFPTVDFHMATQRLAVGTNEGAIIMYDLKTGTRLYVLEGHTRRLAACSFSPDGRRMVTVSLEEGVVLVWKVGSSFTSFFKPGAPPRQGHGGSEPFKTLSFNVGDEANMTIAGTLEWVRFEWPTERSVKLKIRESTLTFST